MQRQMLKSKIHRATITDCDMDYVGSVTLDPELMRRPTCSPNEQVHVWDIDNGARFVTYAIEGEPGSGAVQVNGAAARLVSKGDKVIVASFAAYGADDLETLLPGRRPRRRRNAVAAVDSHPVVLLELSRSASEAAGVDEDAARDAPDRGRAPVTLPRLAEMKRNGEPIVMVTAYDYPSAQVAEEAGVDVVLVGDTAAMVVLGYDSTTPVGMDEMVTMAAAVRRGLRDAAA